MNIDRNKYIQKSVLIIDKKKDYTPKFDIEET